MCVFVLTILNIYSFSHFIIVRYFISSLHNSKSSVPICIKRTREKAELERYNNKNVFLVVILVFVAILHYVQVHFYLLCFLIFHFSFFLLRLALFKYVIIITLIIIIRRIITIIMLLAYNSHVNIKMLVELT